MKKKTKKPSVKKSPVERRSTASRKTAKAAKRKATTKASAMASQAITAAALGKDDIKKIQALLKLKTENGTTLGLSLLQSLGATRADYETVLTEKIISAAWMQDRPIGSLTVNRWEELLSLIRVSPTLLDRFAECAARAVAKRRRYIDLDGLTTLSDEAAKALAHHKGGGLSLDGLTTLSDKAAKALAGHKGDLYLDGLTTLSDEAAKALAKHKGELSLNGLTTLSADGAKALAKHKDELLLRGLTTLSDEVAKALWANPGVSIPDKFKR